MMHTSRYAEKNNPAEIDIWTGPTPSAFLEYGFYFYMFYTILGGVFGLFINNLASGLLVLLLILCLSELGSQTVTVIRVLAFPLGCGIAYSFIQLFLYEEPLTGTVRAFLLWMLSLLIIQVLALRPNFLHRFVLVMFFFGLAALPYLSSYSDDASSAQRVYLDRAIGFGRPNEMGAWYGFCAVYFVVRGFTARTNTLRNLSWLLAVGSLYVTTLTVSRGALLAIAGAIVMAGRHFLKMGFIPILLLLCLAAIVVELGVFEETTKFYAARGTEDTGRLAVWPLIIDSFLGSPWIGVGHSNAGAYRRDTGRFVTPHNSFLYIAQSSGVIPLALFIAYWLRAVRAALYADVRRSPDTPYYLPMLTFTFLTASSLAFGFQELWAIVSLAIPLTASVQRQALNFSSPFAKELELTDSR
jgi:O-antigen ligase